MHSLGALVACGADDKGFNLEYPVYIFEFPFLTSFYDNKRIRSTITLHDTCREG